ncbi:MAG TPA: alpha/beta hydrolase [Bacilli bacterium]|nr:alpha/beta hydrolase [Bacilli bacterium]
MHVEIDGMKLHYKVDGEGQDVLLLHGWGANIQTFAPVHQFLSRQFRVFSIDFPGFGESDPPPEQWGVYDYTAFLDKFIKKIGITNPILVGHSFGGRVSIVYSSMYGPVKKVILVDSAGIKPKRKLNYYLKVYFYKACKNILKLPILNRYQESILTKVKGMLGSSDYKNASGVMQQSLVKVVNEDLQHLMPKITVPTLLIWGENDEATPVSDGQMMEKLIPDAGLVVLKNAGHYAYLDKLNEFLVIIDKFLERDRKDTTKQ